ncbi:MAG: hypothetical protein U0795_04830 [Pirellulales bacterium]
MIACHLKLVGNAEPLGEDQRILRRPLPPPTTAQPGSRAKIAVLTARVALGMELHHPHDAQHVPAVASPEIPWLRLQLVPRPAKVDD